jgi:prophage maintenance system killer protein
VPASGRWSQDGFDILKAVQIRDLVRAHELATTVGTTHGVGVKKHHFLDSIYREYQWNIHERIDPLYTATRWVKHMVMHRPFADANRRTAFLWTVTHFKAFGRRIDVDTTEAIDYKVLVKNKGFRDVRTWFQDRLT